MLLLISGTSKERLNLEEIEIVDGRCPYRLQEYQHSEYQHSV
jgi:hypothetical protein